VTRPGTLISKALSLAAVTALAGIAGAPVAAAAPARQAAASHAHAHRTGSGARKSGACRTASHRHAMHAAGCSAAGHRAPVRRGAHGAEAHAKRTLSVRAVTPSPTEVAASQSAVLAKVLATPCQNTQLTPEPGNLPLARAAVLCLVNTERAQHGRGPLSPDTRLERAAEEHGREMLSLDYFDHVSPTGLTPVRRISQTGYIPNSEVGYVIGENLAWGTLSLSTPQAIVNAWIASPEHLANILEAKYRETGIDVQPEVPAELAEGIPGALYTQEFGVIVP
jgi:uncharacterized protein YkwD